MADGDGVTTPDLAVVTRPGLVRDANVVTNGSDTEQGADGQTIRWVNGFSYEMDPCGGGHLVDPCQLGSLADVGDTFSCQVVGPISPYVVESSETVSLFGNASEARHQNRIERVRRKLLASQSKLIEAEFWSGTAATARGWTNNQYLTKTSGLTILQSGSALGIVDGLAALEQAIADGSSWERGAIHASPQLVTHWIWQGLVRAVPNPPTGTLMTQLGTVVIAGAGYPGTGPNNAVNPNRLEWAYATPIPQVRLGEITDNDTDNDPVAVDRNTNDRTVRAMRFAAVTVAPCFRAAALILMTTSLQVPGS